MLIRKEIISGVSVILVAGSIAWIVSTLIEVDKRTAITEVKVTENHKMLHTLWVDFIKRKTQNGNLAEFNLSAAECLLHSASTASVSLKEVVYSTPAVRAAG